MSDFAKKLSSCWQDIVNVVLGIWLIAAPAVLGYVSSSAAATNAWVVGVIIAVAAIAALVAFQKWEEWVNMALGAWLIVSPWVLGFADLGVALWNQIIVGVLVAGLALWSAAIEHEEGGLFSKTS